MRKSKGRTPLEQQAWFFLTFSGAPPSLPKPGLYKDLKKFLTFSGRYATILLTFNGGVRLFDG